MNHSLEICSKWCVLGFVFFHSQISSSLQGGRQQGYCFFRRRQERFVFLCVTSSSLGRRPHGNIVSGCRIFLLNPYKEDEAAYVKLHEKEPKRLNSICAKFNKTRNSQRALYLMEKTIGIDLLSLGDFFFPEAL